MKKKSAPVFAKSSPLNVDTTNGIIRNVVILQGGEDKHGDNFDSVALDQLTLLGNAQAQGVKSRFGHPNACSEALGTYIGRYKNFNVSSNSDGVPVVVADLYLDPIAKNAPSKGNLYQYTLDMALSNSDMFGNSIVYNRAEPKVIRELDDNGNEVVKTYERFQSLLASDVVDSPAATTNLFKDDTDFAAMATEFLDEHEQLFEALYKNQNVVGEFLKRYNNYKQEKEKMTAQKKNFADKLKDAISGVINEFQKSADAPSEKATINATLASGDTITISDENGDGLPSEGDIVTDADGQPMASQDLELMDGSMIHTDANGVISSIDPPASSEEPAMNSKSVESLEAVIEQMKREHEAEREATLAEVEKLKSLLSRVKSTGTVPAGTQSFKLTPSHETNAVASARERMKNKK